MNITKCLSLFHIILVYGPLNTDFGDLHYSPFCTARGFSEEVYYWKSYTEICLEGEGLDDLEIARQIPTIFVWRLRVLFDRLDPEGLLATTGI